MLRFILIQWMTIKNRTKKEDFDKIIEKIVV